MECRPAEYPTLLELAGFAAPAHLQGASLVPLLREPTQAWSRSALTGVSRDRLEGRRLGFGLMGRSLRTERFRYTEWDEGRKGTELYDHDHDPGEYMNLAADPRYADVVADVNGLLLGVDLPGLAQGPRAGRIGGEQLPDFGSPWRRPVLDVVGHDQAVTPQVEVRVGRLLVAQDLAVGVAHHQQPPVSVLDSRHDRTLRL